VSPVFTSKNLCVRLTAGFLRVVCNFRRNQSLAVEATLAVLWIMNHVTQKCGVKHPTHSFQALAPGGGMLYAPEALSWREHPLAFYRTLGGRQSQSGRFRKPAKSPVPASIEPRLLRRAYKT